MFPLKNLARKELNHNNTEHDVSFVHNSYNVLVHLYIFWAPSL